MSPSATAFPANSSSSSVNLNLSLLCRALNSTRSGTDPRTSIFKHGLSKPQTALFHRLHHSTNVSLRGSLELSHLIFYTSGDVN